MRLRWSTTGTLATLALVVLTAFASAEIQGFGLGGDGPPRGRNGPPGNGPPGQDNGPAQGNGPGQSNGRGQRRGPGGGPISDLGRVIFFDKNLSNPPGMSCASCHAPEAGFSSPNSYVNQAYGVMPGVVQSRFGNRKPMTISYAWFAPDGPTFWRRRQQTWVGGFFSDGRAGDLQEQASAPMVNPNEMDNTLHGAADPDLVVRKVINSTYTDLVKTAFGNDALTKPSSDVFQMVRQSIADYEKSRDVSPFSSKYDAYVDGQAQLTPSELNGLRLFTGSVTGRPGGAANLKSAQCVSCHTIADSDNGRRGFFTNWTYANIGVPKNPQNPFYKQSKSINKTIAYNPDDDHYVDLGLGGVLYPKRGLPPGNIGVGSDGQGDFLAANGEFRVPTLRNVDKRPDPSFIKCYMHNGVFKSLKEVVHFYNTRNLTKRGEVMDLTASNPRANVKAPPIWPAPEFASSVTLQNPAGHVNGPTARVGNLGLTASEESDIVAFLQTLSDGYFTPQRRRPPPN